MSLTTCIRCGVPIVRDAESPRDDFLGKGRLCLHCAEEEPDARSRFISNLDRLVPTGPAPRPGSEAWKRGGQGEDEWRGRRRR